MSEVAIGQLVWFIIGATYGGMAVAMCLFRWVMRRRPSVTIDWESIKQGLQAEDRIRMQTNVTVDWALITSALRGEGCFAVRRESAVRH